METSDLWNLYDSDEEVQNILNDNDQDDNWPKYDIPKEDTVLNAEALAAIHNQSSTGNDNNRLGGVLTEYDTMYNLKGFMLMGCVIVWLFLLRFKHRRSTVMSAEKSTQLPYYTSQCKMQLLSSSSSSSS